MGKAHMTLHVQNILPGDVPLEWLQEQDSFVCLCCHHIVANSTKCSGSTTGIGPLQAQAASTTVGSSQGDGDDSNAPLPSFEEVCSLRCATVHHIPQKARPAFARALSETLRAICQLNTEEVWLKLFMLPKCVLRASHCGGSRHKPLSIEELCRQWSDGQSASLWRYASEHARKVKAGKEQHSKETGRKVQLAVSKAREGLFGKACKVLSSSGIAPNTRETWNLLEQKHPRGPVPSHPEIVLPAESFKLPPDLDIRSVLYQFPRDSACGPSGLRIQHLIEAVEVHLPISICSSLRAIVNILADGRAPIGVAKFLAGGSLTALMKNKEGSPLDLRPIVVLGVAYPAGAEKLVHGFRRCISEHWGDREFVACKVDLKNAFNEVLRQALLEECATHFPELFRWVYWCYGQHPTLWHPMGTLGSEQGVHQGDPLGPLLFSLVLQKLVRAIAADKECSNLLFNRWYLDDGTLAGPTDAVKRAIQLIQQIGPPMGLRINATKCELISQGSLEGFPADMKRQHDSNVEILGAPIGDVIFCAKFLAQKRAKAVRLLSQVAEVGSIDPQIALLLLRQCASFCKLVHVARSTPPSLVSEGLALFDWEVQCYFSDCVGIDASDAVWQQVQLSLSRGGLGLRRLELHCSAAYLASVIKTSNSDPLDEFSRQAVSIYNSLVPQASSLSDNSLLEARLGGQLEVGYGSGGDVSNSRPADFLVPNWTLGKPAAFDLTVVSPLNSNTLIEAGSTSGSAAAAKAAAPSLILASFRVTGDGTNTFSSQPPQCVSHSNWPYITRATLFDFVQSNKPSTSNKSGDRRLATSRHLAPLAETLATMMSRGALLFGDGHLDGRTLWTGDKAEKLTSGVARKESNFLCGLGPRKRNITWKLSRRTMWIFCFSNHGSLTRVDSAIALAKDGLYSKTCQMLTSQGLAPDDDNTWNLLISKHPQGLRIQHLIDAADVPLSSSILQSLKGVVNILAAGRAPPMIASFLAGVSEIVLEPGCANLLYHAWYLDDGVVAGSSTEWLLQTISSGSRYSTLVLRQSSGAFRPGSAYIASVCSSGYGLQSLTHLTHAVEMFNVCVAPADKISLDSLASSNINQKMLSSKLDDYQLQGIFNRSSVADLLSISAPHSSSWLSVVPSEGLGLHFEPNQYNVALKWWLGLDTSCDSSCAFCPDSILDPLGHHASTCKRGGDAVHRHNLLRDVFADSCRLAHLPVKLEVGNNLTPDHDHSRPADVLVHNWSLGKPAAFDFCVTSPLNSIILSEAGVSSGVAAQASEQRRRKLL
eukprot:Em0001g766a